MLKTALILFACSLLTVVTHVTIVEQNKGRPLPTASTSPAPIRQQLPPELPPVRVENPELIIELDNQIVRNQTQDNNTTIYQDNDQDNDTYITLPPAQPPPRRVFRVFLPVVENK